MLNRILNTFLNIFLLGLYLVGIVFTLKELFPSQRRKLYVLNLEDKELEKE